MKHIKHINPRKIQKIEKPKSKIIQHISYIFQKGSSNISAHALITCLFFPEAFTEQNHWCFVSILKAKWWPLQPLIYIYICPEFNLASILSNIKFITVNFFDWAFQSSCVWFPGTHHMQYSSFCYNLNHIAFVHTLIQEKLKRLKIPSLKLSSIYHISSKRKHFRRFCTGANHL